MDKNLLTVSRARRREDLAQAGRLFLPRVLHDLVGGLSGVLEGEVRRLAYLGPLRSYPPRHLAFSQHHDPNWFAGGGYAWDIVRTRREVRERVNEWLGDDERLKTPYEVRVLDLIPELDLPDKLYDLALGLIEELERTEPSEEVEALRRAVREGKEDEDAGVDALMDAVDSLVDIEGSTEEWVRQIVAARSEALQELALVDKRSGTVVSHRDVGIGVSQVLPVLVSAYASRGSLLAIEQPEIHLHPALQAELGDVVIESALGPAGNSFLIETHSEHLLLRIMRRMRETATDRLPEGLPPVGPEPCDGALRRAGRYPQPGPGDASQRARGIGEGVAGRLLRRGNARDLLMPLFADCAITPGVFDVESYSSEDVHRIRLGQIYRVISKGGLVRDLRDGEWRSFLLGEQRHWHPRTREIVTKWAQQGRLIAVGPALPSKPACDVAWCAEAWESHRQQPMDGGVVVPCVTKKNRRYRRIPRIGSVDSLSQASWWPEDGDAIGVERSLAGYRAHLHLILRWANSIQFVDPYIDPSLSRYRDFVSLLGDAGTPQSRPTIEIHRQSDEQDDTQKPQTLRRRFRVGLEEVVRDTGLRVDVFLWRKFHLHDRCVISDLIGISCSNGFDTAEDDTTSWGRMTPRLRDDMQRKFDPASRSTDLRDRFTVL